MTRSGTRTVVGNISLSLDGRSTGPGGDHDMGWVGAHAVSDGALDLLERLMSTSTTVLLGRKNYEGFGGYWPTVADDESADPRVRAFSRWLDAADKVVFSTTLTEATWQNSRLAESDPASVVKELRRQDGGDIWVMSSGSVIRALLEADELDRLSIVLCPELVGGGARFFPDGLPASSWSLTDLSTTDSGAICLLYDRVR
ncbi:dihydrofolate reductase family protein [Pseudonocardia nigra]|uniref:dihydrofolate reductase family protein n=1 Tax=Pseudonocardia nigra TaxID=1921578 RepID=UPI001C5E3765|nr:dihydrofolate reductase family protein [Pseudonocardia nigra]